MRFRRALQNARMDNSTTDDTWPATTFPSLAKRRSGYETRIKATNPSLTPVVPAPPADDDETGMSNAEKRAQYEARIAAKNPPLTPLRRANPAATIAAPDALAPGPGLAPANTPAPTAAGPNDAAPDPNTVPKPGLPNPSNDEAQNPLTDNAGTALPGAITPFQSAQPSPAGHFGGDGIYKRKFSNPSSANMYDNYVRKIFSKTTNVADQSPSARTGLRMALSADA
jgi:hypothetical protein